MHIERFEPRLLFALLLPDPGFAAEGVTTADIGAIRALRTASDGSVFAAGGSEDIFGITHFGPSGEVLDEQRGSGGGATFHATFQPDGKALLGSEISGQYAIRRLNVDGTTDTSFGAAGVVILPSFSPHQSSIGPPLNIAEAPDGKIVVAGSVDLSTGDFDHLVIARLTSTGALDTTFDGDGKLFTALADHRAHSVAVDSVGRILVTGENIGTGNFVVRLDSSGAFDSTFGVSGRLESTPSNAVPASDVITALTDGRILLAGSGNDPARPTVVARLNTDGTLDSTFATDGAVFLGSGESFGAETLDDAGDIFVVGSIDNRISVFKLNADGTLASAFGDAGVNSFTTDLITSVSTMAVASDGDIYLGDDFNSLLRIAVRPQTELAGNGILIVTGTTSADNVAISLAGGTVTLNCNGTARTYASSSVSGVDIATLEGPDTVNISFDTPCTISAGAGDDAITWANGDDSIDAGDGKNTIQSGDGNDIITAGSGDDTAIAGNGAHTINLGDGNNTITTGFGSDHIATGSGNDHLTLGGGFDAFIEVGNGDNFVRIGADGGDLTSGAGNDTIIGSDRGDSLVLQGGNDSVTCGSGDDFIATYGGSPTIFAGGGDDHITDNIDESGRIDGGAGNDLLILRGSPSAAGGDGNDSIALFSGAGTLSGGAGNDLIRAASDADKQAVIYGGDGNDTIFTGDGDDSIFGEGGKDNIHAGLGNDFASGGGGNDRIFGQTGNDTIHGGRGDDRLDGGDGNDSIIGGAGNDNLFGQAGDDNLNGDSGIDRSFGGDGNDSGKRDPIDLVLEVETVT